MVLASQTAVVTGDGDEEIHVDAHGRIKVQFHWDRKGRHDGQSSCWIRVAQNWAGGGWGFMFIPRVGMEVVVIVPVQTLQPQDGAGREQQQEDNPGARASQPMPPPCAP